MPTYENPNPHTVDIAIAMPRTTLRVFPRAWPAAQVTAGGGKQTVELDAVLAKTFIDLGMLVEKKMKCESCRILAVKLEEATKPVAGVMDDAAAASGTVDEVEIEISKDVEVDSPSKSEEAEPAKDETRKARRKSKLPALEIKAPSHASQIDEDEVDESAPSPVKAPSRRLRI